MREKLVTCGAANGRFGDVVKIPLRLEAPGVTRYPWARAGGAV